MLPRYRGKWVTEAKAFSSLTAESGQRLPHQKSVSTVKHGLRSHGKSRETKYQVSAGGSRGEASQEKEKHCE